MVMEHQKKYSVIVDRIEELIETFVVEQQEAQVPSYVMPNITMFKGVEFQTRAHTNGDLFGFETVTKTHGPLEGQNHKVKKEGITSDLMEDLKNELQIN